MKWNKVAKFLQGILFNKIDPKTIQNEQLEQRIYKQFENRTVENFNNQFIVETNHDFDHTIYLPQVDESLHPIVKKQTLQQHTKEFESLFEHNPENINSLYLGDPNPRNNNAYLIEKINHNQKNGKYQFILKKKSVLGSNQTLELTKDEITLFYPEKKQEHQLVAGIQAARDFLNQKIIHPFQKLQYQEEKQRKENEFRAKKVEFQYDNEYDVFKTLIQNYFRVKDLKDETIQNFAVPIRKAVLSVHNIELQVKFSQELSPEHIKILQFLLEPLRETLSGTAMGTKIDQLKELKESDETEEVKESDKIKGNLSKHFVRWIKKSLHISHAAFTKQKEKHPEERDEEEEEDKQTQSIQTFSDDTQDETKDDETKDNNNILELEMSGEYKLELITTPTTTNKSIYEQYLFSYSNVETKQEGQEKQSFSSLFSIDLIFFSKQ